MPDVPKGETGSASDVVAREAESREIKNFIEQVRATRDIMPLPPVLWPDKRISKKAKKVESFGAETYDIIFEMMGTALYYGGVGLAANQIGSDANIFITHNPKTEQFRMFINPEIIMVSGWQKRKEGCLSLPGVHGTTNRPAEILLRFQNEHGDLCEELFMDFDAQVVSHEMDHLAGQNILTRITAVDKAACAHSIEALQSLHDQVVKEGSKNA